MKLTLVLIIWTFASFAMEAQQLLIDRVLTGDTVMLSSGWERLNLAKSRLVVLKNEQSLIPFVDLASEKTVAISFDYFFEWRKYLWRYQQIPLYRAEEVVADSVHDDFEAADRIIILLDNVDDITNDSLISKWFAKLAADKRCCLVYSGEAQTLHRLNGMDEIECVVLTQQDDMYSRDVVIQLIYGAISCKGKLPFDISDDWCKGAGIDVLSKGRLSYSFPEAFGMDHVKLNHKVDSIVSNAVRQKAFPGCRVLVAVKGTVIFNRSYGFHTYEAIQAVEEHDVFDLASVTKITGPLPLLMKAKDDGFIDLDQPFASYWSDWQKSFLRPSNKSTMTVREVLTHQAGLQPYINYYPLTLKKGRFIRKWYQFSPDSKHSLQIGDHLYLEDKFKKVVYQKIRQSPVSKKKMYKYSGLSFMIYPELISQLYHIDYQENLNQSFYEPLGASTLVYNPIGKISMNRILPTELDTNYRHQQIHGLVHDEAAAVMGGVSGNAGLFGSAHDLAKLMQMYLQFGEYGGKRYIREETLREFTSVQFPENENRRGVGFDKPLFGNDTLGIEKSYPAPGVSSASFGHSGFTGTFVWLDPHYELMYIFLSNRVYPTRNNPKIYQLNVRPSIQQVFYDALPAKN